MSIIRNHKAAFAAFIALELMGLGGIIVMLDTVYIDAVFAVGGLLFSIGSILLLASIICGIVGAVRHSRTEEKHDPSKFEDGLAYQYMMSSKAGIAYWIFVALLTPITPFLLVHLLDYYFVGATLICLGLMVFLAFAGKDILTRSFYRIKDADRYIDMRSGNDAQLLKELYGDYVHVYVYEDWVACKPKFICGLLRREKSLLGRIICYRLTDGYLSKHFGHEYNHHLDDIVLVPFSQFEAEGKHLSSLYKWFNQLSLTTYTSLANAKYGSKCSLQPEDYAHTQSGISLRPFAAGIHGMGRMGEDLFIALGDACATGNYAHRYHDCLMVLRGAAPDDEEIESRLIAESEKYITGFSLSDDGKQLQLTVIIDDDIDAENWTMSEDEYSPEHTLLYRFERIDWYWDAFCDTGRIEQLKQKMNPEK